MTISVYPRYVGPTIDYRLASLYPKWLNIVGDIVIPPGVGEWLGDVVVLDAQTGVAAVGSAVAAMVASVETGVLNQTNRLNVLTQKGATGATVSVVEYGMRTIGGALTTVYATLKAGVLNLTARGGAIQRGAPGVEASDEDPMI